MQSHRSVSVAAIVAVCESFFALPAQAGPPPRGERPTGPPVGRPQACRAAGGPSGPPPVCLPLSINEFGASNKDLVFDPQGDADDWIELHNPTTTPLSLDGWSMSDDLSDPHPLASGLTVPAGGVLLLWADKDVLDGPQHLPFKLNSCGEGIFLWDDLGNLADQVTFGPMRQDSSRGRYPDSSSTFSNWDYTAATPGALNSVGCLTPLAPPLLSVVGGAHAGAISVDAFPAPPSCSWGAPQVSLRKDL